MLTLGVVTTGISYSYGSIVVCDEALGFNSQTLACSVCDDMKQFSLSDTLQDACNACCIQAEEQEEEQIEKYASAELLICNWKLGRFPQIKEFIDNEKKSFKNLKVNYVRGASPVIKFKNGENEVQDTIAIDGWDRGAIKEFLSERL